jgi:ParB-like chromosome segregation protein Spo0J
MAKVDSDIVFHTKMALVDAGKLNPAAYNPRKITSAKLEALKASIRENGFVEPIVIQRSRMAIVGGHQRYRALREMSEERGVSFKLLSVPCIVLDLTDRQAMLLNIALNNTSGEFDDEMLRVLVKRVERDQEITASEALSTGFTQRQIEALIAPVKVSEDGDNLPFASSVTLSLAFDSVSERDAVKGLLAELAVGASKKTGTIVRELLEARASSNRKKAQI